jgi:predicted O-methyltransferase YrrM
MKYTPLNDVLHTYITELFPADDAFLHSLKQEARDAGMPAIHIAPEQLAFLQLFLRATGAQRVLEIGSLAGYSAIGMARVLPANGSFVAIEREPERAAFIERKAAEAGANLEVTLTVLTGDAKEILHNLQQETPIKLFDFIFIDADKRGYTAYLELALLLLRTGGTLCADNTLARGGVAQPTPNDAITRAVDEFNRAVSRNANLQSCLVPIGEGMTFATKIR